jgi:type VI secretion system protein VasD
MSRTVFNVLMLATFAVSLAGCGLAQTMTDGTASSTRAIFHKQMKTLQLDFSAPTTPDLDAAHVSALSVPTLVRIYQLRDSEAIEKASYDSVLGDDDNLLNSALLDKRVVVVKPGEAAHLRVPLDPRMQVVAVVALFHGPESSEKTWRLTLARGDLAPNRTPMIELDDHRLSLRPLAED